MKFFKKRLNKRKLTKSLTETALVVPTVHQNDNSKPLPPSPSLISMPQQATMVENGPEATNNSDSWLELNLPNDFSSSFDLPQLQPHQKSQATSTNDKLEIITEKSPPHQESENITETSLFSYPNNHIDTTSTHHDTNTPESVSIVVAAAAAAASSLEPSSSSTSNVVVDGDNNQDESPLQPVEKQGDPLLNDTSRDANVLANATLIPTDDMQHVELEEERDEWPEIDHHVSEEQVEETAVAATNAFLALSASTSTSTSTTAAPTLTFSLAEQDAEKAAVVIEREDTTEGMELPNSSVSTEQKALQTESPVDKCTIGSEVLSNLLIVAPPSLTTTTTTTTTTSSPSEMAPLVGTEEPSPSSSQAASSQGLQREIVSKIAKRKSAISLIPRKQPSSSVNVPDANINKKDGRRASSSSFIPVLATRHQHPNNTVCSMPSKDAVTTMTVPVTWSPSSSSERNSVSSDSTSSSCSSQHQGKRTSLIMKSSAAQQPLLQSKIPKASFGMPFAPSSTEISKVLPTAQQHVSKLPTKRNSTLA